MTDERSSLPDVFDEMDITAMILVIDAFTQKFVPFLDEHEDHSPILCPFADPALIASALNLVAHLQALVDGFNELRIEQGKEPLASLRVMTVHAGGFNC